MSDVFDNQINTAVSSAHNEDKTLLYIRFGPGKSEAAVMDNLLSFLNGDLSIWGVIAMPVGVAICFGPALFMWLKAELGTKPADKDEDRR